MRDSRAAVTQLESKLEAMQLQLAERDAAVAAAAAAAAPMRSRFVESVCKGKAGGTVPITGDELRVSGEHLAAAIADVRARQQQYLREAAAAAMVTKTVA